MSMPLLMFINLMLGIAAHLLKPLADDFRPGASNIIRYTIGGTLLLVLFKPILDRLLGEKIPDDVYAAAAATTGVTFGSGVIIGYLTDSTR